LSAQTILQNVGISAFGIAMPRLALAWTDGSAAAIEIAPLSLTISSGTWRAPLPVAARAYAPLEGITLLDGTGSPVGGPGILLTVLPGAWLRLSRLYAQLLESESPERPLRERGLSVRPVPRFFFIARVADSFGGLDPALEAFTPLEAGEDVGMPGRLTIHDQDGLPIDPLAVASAFTAFMAQHRLLQARALDAAFQENHRVRALAERATGPATRVRLSNLGGQPYDATNLTGLAADDASLGVFSASGTIEVAAVSSSFPADQRRLLVVGPATTGRLGEHFQPPPLPASAALSRDFFSLRVVELRPALLGESPSAWTTQTRTSLPPIRRNEPLTLLRDGNDVLAAAEGALAAASLTETIAVAQSIEDDFDVPDRLGADAQWPLFPPLGAGAAPGTGLSGSTRAGLTMMAARFDSGESTGVDVLLTLSGLPAHAAARIFPRLFNADATESRGDGAGGVADAGGALTLLLRDPFGLRPPGEPSSSSTIPPGATLRVDLAVVTRSGTARIFGNLSAIVADESSTDAPPATGTNAFGSAGRRSVCRAGILGLGRPQALPSDPSALDIVRALAGEGDPRDPPRFPTMARRELLAASRDDAGTWRAVLSAGRLARESLSALPHRGSPGAPGGRETQLVGLATENGRLAYDIARAAFRRTTNVISRVVELLGDRWDEPAEPGAPAAGATATPTSGTFAAAVLQTIAPLAETPELSLLRNELGSIPEDLPSLLRWVRDRLPSDMPLRTQIDRLLSELGSSENAGRAYAELVRELSVSGYGRRDAQWAIRSAIERARHFIYIESPGFGPTARSAVDEQDESTLPAYAADLQAALRDRLRAVPGLHVAICVPREPVVGPGYQQIAAREIKEREISILGDPTSSPPRDGLEPATTPPSQSRVVAFHPIGFPGRPSALEGTAIVVDDTWLLAGSSTFRRRGLTFDGGTDAVLIDTDFVEGVSPAIRAFRQRLMATRLGVPEHASGRFGFMPDPRFIRLGEPREAMHVVRETLRAGGLGHVARLYRGNPRGETPDPALGASFRAASPEGQEVVGQLDALVELLLVAALAGGSAA
jgi:hypothetical protein